MYGYFFRFNQLVFFGLVCFCASLAFVPSLTFASAFSPVSGATIQSPASPIVTTVGTSYRFAANDPRIVISPPNQDFPSPKGTVSKTYTLESWRPKALPALRLSGASFALFFAADAVCQTIDCVNLVWGQPMTTLGDGPAVTTDYSAFPNYFGTRSVIVVGTASSIGWNALSESDRNQIQSWLDSAVFGTRPIATVLAFRAVPVNVENNLYQQQFRVLYTFTDTPTPLQCPQPYVVSGSRCIAPAGGDTIPFDESYFVDAVPAPNVSPAASELNQALFRELDRDSVSGDISISLEPVTNTKTESITNSEGDFIRETIEEFTYPVSNNNSPSPSINPVKSTTTNLYQNGNLVDSETVVEENTSEGSQPQQPLEDCDLFPSICAFIDWVTDYDEPEEPDLSSLSIDDQEIVDFTFSAPSGSCPAPLQISLSSFGSSVTFDYDLICDYAAYIKIFVLLAASFFSSRIVLRSIN